MEKDEKIVAGIEVPVIDPEILDSDIRELKVKIIQHENQLLQLKLKLTLFEFVKKYSVIFCKGPETEENG